jgi:hypothetical protein
VDLEETEQSQSLLKPKQKTFADMLTKVKTAHKKGDHVTSKPQVLGATAADLFSPTFLSQPFISTQIAGSSTPLSEVEMDEPKSALKRAHQMTEEDSLDQSLPPANKSQAVDSTLEEYLVAMAAVVDLQK